MFVLNATFSDGTVFRAEYAYSDRAEKISYTGRTLPGFETAGLLAAASLEPHLRGIARREGLTVEVETSGEVSYLDV